MGLIRFRCDDDLERRFEEAATKATLTPSQLGRAVFTRAFPAPKQNEDTDTTVPPSASAEADDEDGASYEYRTEKVYTQLTPSEHRAVSARAKAMSMKPYTWIMRLIRAHLTKAPQLNYDETRALREATRELSYIGRNLNQVAHALNITYNARETATKELIGEINTKVDEVRAEIKAVLDQNLNRWGV